MWIDVNKKQKYCCVFGVRRMELANFLRIHVMPIILFVAISASGIVTCSDFFDSTVLPKWLSVYLIGGIAAFIMFVSAYIQADIRLCYWDVALLVCLLYLLTLFCINNDIQNVFNVVFFLVMYFGCRQYNSGILYYAFVVGVTTCFLYAVATCLYELLNGQNISGGYDTISGLSVVIAFFANCSIWLLVNQKFNKVLVKMGLLLCLLLIIILSLRAALIAVMCTVLFLLKKKLRYVMIVVAGVTILLMSVNKIDSTSGRYFICKTSMSLLDSPRNIICGRGRSGFRSSYMPIQARALKAESSYVKSLADNIKHPLNEFVYFAVNYGVLPVIICGVLLGALFIKGNTDFLSFSIIVSSVCFSLFTYPFHYPILYIALAFSLAKLVDNFSNIVVRRKRTTSRIFSVLCLVASIFLVLNSLGMFYWNLHWKMAYASAMYTNTARALKEYKHLAESIYVNDEFYYNWAYVLIRSHKLDEARLALGQCAVVDYDTEMLKGDLHMQEGGVSEAIKYYQEASDMCPNRFLPLYAQFLTYQRSGLLCERDQIGKQILLKEQKVKSPVVSDIIKNVQDAMYSDTR